MAGFSEIINKDQPVLVDFFAEWCGPYKTMKPILEKVKEQIGDSATILKVDVDRNAAAANQYQIRSVPTLVLFKKGKVVWRQSGVVPAHQLEAVIRQYQ